jgi:hypothetical protein
MADGTTQPDLVSEKIRRWYLVRRKQRIAVAAQWDGQRLSRLKTDLLDNVDIS